jgi:hypothetical protein
MLDANRRENNLAGGRPRAGKSQIEEARQMEPSQGNPNPDQARQKARGRILRHCPRF